MAPAPRLSVRQEAALVAFIDALLPPLPAPSSSDSSGSNSEDSSSDAAKRFWEYRLSADPAFVAAVQVAILQKMSTHDRFLTQTLLTALSTSLGTSAIFGVWTTHAFCEWSVPERMELLQRAQHSRIEARRKVFHGLKRFLCGLAFSYTNDSNENPFWEAMGYPGSPVKWQLEVVDQQQVQAAMQRQAPIIKALDQSQQQLVDSDVLECDVVIVGSGSGGCVAAKTLAVAGYKVVVLEKGCYMAPENIQLAEAAAMDQQYEQHGLLQTTSGSIMILAGAGVGGGTAINWSCCLPLPDYVREEWVALHGLQAFASAEYETSLQHVLATMGASEPSKMTHNAMNDKLQQGCDALEYKWETTGQNLRDAGDVAAGYIGMGDRYGNKNGGIQAFLLEAVNNGAKIVENCRVDRVITDTATKQRRATGVQCQVGARKLTVKARKAVILAAGALQTPCLLQKSGFQNKHIGKHLRLHPTTGVIGFFPADNPIDAILGAPMTTACNEFARGPADDGYGVKIECPCAYPGLLAAATPWTSAQIFRDRMLRYRNMVPLVLVQRDSGDGGHVKAARDGVGITIDYTVSKQDKKSQMKAMRGAAQILVASGSTEVATGHIRDVGFKTGGKKVDDASLHEYLDAIDSRGMKDHEIGLFSAHQMGSCRMSTSPLAGVVDPNGEAWECDDLFIMDASVFPTASGSNPMVTVLTITYMLSSRLCSSLKLRDNPDGKNVSSGFSAGDRAKAVELSREREMMRSYEDATLLASLGNVAVIFPLLLAFVLGWLFGRF